MDEKTNLEVFAGRCPPHTLLPEFDGVAVFGVEDKTQSNVSDDTSVTELEVDLAQV